MFFGLMRSRRFAPLFWCQFLSALNDNCVRQMLAMLILFDLGQNGAGALITLAVGIFILPSLLLSALGGEIADASDKARVARVVKAVEIFVQAIAATGFLLHSPTLLFAALFGLGVIAALFGPIKYGILPDHLETAELPAGNALIEGATFLAILFGLIAGGTLVANDGAPWLVALQLMVVAFACWATSHFIPATGIAAPDLKINRNVLTSTVTLVRELRRDRHLWAGGIAVSWFWMTGAVALALVPVIVRTRIGGDIAVETAITALFAIGIGGGSILSAIIAQGRISLLPVPIAALLVAVFLIDLGALTLHLPASASDIGVVRFLTSGIGLRIAVDVVATAVAGALLVVPAFTAVQAWAGEERRARVVAAVNVLSALFMVVGSLVAAALQIRQIAISQPVLLIGLGVLNAGAGLYFFHALPGPFADAVYLLVRVGCRLEVTGAEHITAAGDRALIVAHHNSRFDALAIWASLAEKPLFVVDPQMLTHWWAKPFRAFCIAVEPDKPAALRYLIRAIKNGRRAVIFLDRGLTPAQTLPKAYAMAAFIADKADAHIVAAQLDVGLQRRVLAFSAAARQHLFTKMRVVFAAPRRLSQPFGRGSKRHAAAGAAIHEMMGDLAMAATPLDRTLIEALAATARHYGPAATVIEDPLTGALSGRRFLTASAVLARKIMLFSQPGECLGLVLPNANAALVAFFSVQAAGRVVAMLNYTAGGTNMRAACVAAGITSIITSRAFVEKAGLDALIAEIGTKAAIIYLEDLRDGVTALNKLRGLYEAGRQLHPRSPDDPAAVLFTSGSEAAPKGVVLSHRNIIANVAQVVSRFDVSSADRAFNVLPVFHAFGLTSCTLLPMLAGVKVYLYPSPLHYRQIVQQIRDSGATYLFGTDTFLKQYGRLAGPDTFRTLRYVVAGGEPVSAETRALYEGKFGVTLLEGYGVTEAAPVIAVNTPLFNRPGTAGRLLAGIEVRLDPVDGIAEGGRLNVRGPNIMRGYYRADNPGVIEAPPQGWHDTTDIVAIDADGFLTIKGRAKRFAKIGGEMVSLAAIEQICGQLWGEDAIAVVACPDTRKGERLVLVTLRAGGTRAEVHAFMKARGAADVMVPAEVMIVEALPRLGSGKVDYVELNRLVRSRRGLATVP